MTKYVIVGGVAGGMSAAARLRRLDETCEIVVFERGEYVSYANCGLPYYVGDAIKEREQLLLQTPASFRARFNVEVKTGHEVTAIFPSEKSLTVKKVESGEELRVSYDRLLLAPGGSPVRPPIPSIDHPAIHTLWTIPDSDRIRALVDDGKVQRALVVGAGFIGLEMVENLHARGVDVTLVEAANQVMGVVDFEMAAIVQRELRLEGVTCHIADGVESFAPAENGGVSAELISGLKVAADLVILAVGVAPNTGFLAGSGIELGRRGHIVVDGFLKTSVADVFAVGNAIEVVNPLTGARGAVPLAGPANKQGRIAADNMLGVTRRSYRGTLGTSIAKVFDLDVAVTGLTEKACKIAALPYDSVIVHPNDHAGYYPMATMLTLKLLFATDTRRVLGAQAVGYEGVDKRIDVIATAIQAGMTVDELCEIEHAYAPPYSSAKDPVNMAGFAAQNILDGLYGSITWDRLVELKRKPLFMLDVRTADEFALGTIEGAVNVPLDELRGRVEEIPRDRQIVIFCRVGLRGYLAARLLGAYGFAYCVNLSGGLETYQLSTMKDPHISFLPGHKAQRQIASDSETGEAGAKGEEGLMTTAGERSAIEVNACGLQCPGPVLRLKKEMDLLPAGEMIDITASDPGFYNDVQAWARSTGNVVRKVEQAAGRVRALVEKGGAAPQVSVSGGNDKTIVVFSGDLDKVIASFVIANGALAMGRKVTMFFTFWGINALRHRKKPSGLGKNLIEAAFGMMMPQGSRKLALSRMSMGGIGGKLIRGIMKNKNVPSLEEMIELAIEGGAKLVACQMSMDLMGIRREELIEGIEIGGVAAYLEASEHADNNLFI